MKGLILDTLNTLPCNNCIVYPLCYNKLGPHADYSKVIVRLLYNCSILSDYLKERRDMCDLTIKMNYLPSDIYAMVDFFNDKKANSITMKGKQI